jgi:hypothetical protein
MSRTHDGAVLYCCIARDPQCDLWQMIAFYD